MFKKDFLNTSWLKALVLSAFSVYIYVFMEWIFFSTKPSFMSTMDMKQKTMILFVSAFVLVLFALVLTGLTILIHKVLPAFAWIMALTPALVFTFLSLILFDNFTYTVFKFGIVTSQGIWRSVYAAAVILVFIFYARRTANHLQNRSSTGVMLPSFTLLLLFISTVVFISNFHRFRWNPTAADSQAVSAAQMPNIILLGWDGINATHMSVLGYERDTTPNLTRLSSDALFFENAYPNAGKTGGSLTSLLTGKYSTDTRVVFPPDILLGEDAYQHLPGILKQLGYSTVQISMPYYGDAYERNIREGFDVVNFHAENSNPLLKQFAKMGGEGSFYFVGQIILRIQERLTHIFHIKTMDNPYAAVTTEVPWMSDRERLDAMLRYLDETDQPLFLNVHMMDMHGPMFKVPQPFFSAGQVQREEWMMDFYDDAILNADAYLQELFDHLSRSGQIGNTIVILYSDHGMDWEPLARVPLIFWFPDGQYAQRVRENAQLLDVAPTLLDYLDVPQPEWMKGRSLLTEGLPAARRIFSATVGPELKLTEDGKIWLVDQTKISPPFYQLGEVNMVVCDQWFSLDLRNPKLTHGRMEGSTSLCLQSDMPSPQEAQTLLLQHLSDAHYDITEFPVVVPIEGME
jgi:arylsulfatase A-like enzyme